MLLLSLQMMNNALVVNTWFTSLIYSRRNTSFHLSPSGRSKREQRQTGTHVCPSTAELAQGWDALPTHQCPAAEARPLMSKCRTIPELEPSTPAQALNYRRDSLSCRITEPLKWRGSKFWNRSSHLLSHGIRGICTESLAAAISVGFGWDVCESDLRSCILQDTPQADSVCSV